jgi:hypothetical protein
LEGRQSIGRGVNKALRRKGKGITTCRLINLGVNSSDKIRNPLDSLSPEERAITEPVDALAPAGKAKANESKKSIMFIYRIVNVIMIIVL